MWPQVFVNFFGWLLFLLGIYISLKIIFNLVYFKEKYPVQPIIGYSNVFPQYEEDCYQGTFVEIPRKDLDLQETRNYKDEMEREIKNCISKIRKARKETKIRDIWSSFMFMFLGGGILITKRFYLK